MDGSSPNKSASAPSSRRNLKINTNLNTVKNVPTRSAGGKEAQQQVFSSYNYKDEKYTKNASTKWNSPHRQLKCSHIVILHAFGRVRA